jgi:hypothetical protein
MVEIGIVAATAESGDGDDKLVPVEVAVGVVSAWVPAELARYN